MKKLLENTCNIWSDDSLRLICAPSVLAKDTFLYLQEVGYFKTVPPYSTERANLPSYLLLYTLSGEGILEINGQQSAILPGSCMLINCMEHHRYYTAESKTWEFLWAHFYGSGSAGYYQLFSENGVHAVQIGSSQPFADLFWSMIRRQQNWHALQEISINQELVSILTTLLLACEKAEHLAGNIPTYIQLAVREIERNCASSFSLDSMAEKFNISKYHFSRAFKQHMGMNFSDYINHMRLKLAKELLKYTNQTVNDIAFTCGFNDVSYFIRIFKKMEGYTPLVYRKHWHIG